MKSKSFLTILGLVVAMLLLVSFNSISESFTQNLDSNYLGEGILSVESNQSFVGSIDEIGISENQLDKLNELKYVTKVIPIYSKFINSNFSNNNILELVFLNSSDYNNLGIKIFDGRHIKGSSEILIGINYKEASKREIRDYLRFNNKTYKIVGVFTGNMNYLNSIIMSSDNINSSDAVILNKVLLKIDENHENEVVENLNDIDGLKVIIPDNSHKGTENFVNNAMNYIYIFSIIFGSIIVLYTILSSVNDRVREIGVLKSVGWSNNRIILMIIGESLFLCLISGVIGILFSFLVINYIISNFLSFEMILSPLMFFKAFLILLCIGILGGFYPSLKASSFSPSESLKYE